MDENEIEDLYQREIESHKQLFISGLKEKRRSRKDLEQEFRENLKESREKYYKKIRERLKIKEKKKEKKVKSEKIVPFKAQKANLDIGIKNKLKNFFNLKKFILKVKWRKLRKNSFPPWLLFRYFKTRVQLIILSNAYHALKDRIIDSIKEALSEMKEILKKVQEKIKTIVMKAFKYLLSKISKKKDKKTKDKEETNSDQNKNKPD